MTISGANLNALDCQAKPKPKYVDYQLLWTSPNNFNVIDGKGNSVGTLDQQAPNVRLDLNGFRLSFRKQGTRDEHALAYGILFIIIVLSVAIYYTNF